MDRGLLWMTITAIVVSSANYLFWRLATPEIFCSRSLDYFWNNVSLEDDSNVMVAHIGIHTVPQRIFNRAFLRSILTLSLPLDFSYEFVFTVEGTTSEMAPAMAAEMLLHGDSVILSEKAPEGWTCESHYKTMQWFVHVVEKWPNAKYYIKTDDDTFISYPRLESLLMTVNPSDEFVYFGRDDAMHASHHLTRKYMVGFMYGLSNSLANLIVSNRSGVIVMIEEQGYHEDLQTAHWIHLLEKRGESFDGKLNHVYSNIQNYGHTPIQVAWLDWTDYIGTPDFVNYKGWEKPINDETLAMHGILSPQDFFKTIHAYCDSHPPYRLCSDLDQLWARVIEPS